jgi:hypothetical protein
MLPAQQSCPGVPVEFSRDQNTAVINTTQLPVAFNLQHGKSFIPNNCWRFPVEGGQQRPAHL